MTQPELIDSITDLVRQHYFDSGILVGYISIDWTHSGPFPEPWRVELTESAQMNELVRNKK